MKDSEEMLYKLTLAICLLSLRFGNGCNVAHIVDYLEVVNLSSSVNNT